MSKKETDISLIKKYLNGELDARAMHQLEARAQDDPFLMDALEGYQHIKADQQSNLAELSGRLKQRAEKKERRIIPWRTLAIAASVLFVFSISGLWLFNSKPAEKIKPLPLAKSAPASINTDTVATDVTAAKPETEAIAAAPAQIKEDKKTVLTSAKPYQLARVSKTNAGKYTTAPASVLPAAPVSEDNDSTSLAEMIVMGMNDKKSQSKDTTNTVNQFAALSKAKKVPTTAPEVQLPNSVAGLMKTPAPGTEIYPLGKPQLKFVAGKILDKTDGSPLPGASVALAGSHKTTVTDANGFFTLPVKNNTSKLVVSSAGYESQNVNVYKNNINDSLHIQLVPANSSLNEVIALGYGDQRKHSIDKSAPALPKDGWASYKTYLKENAVSPDNKEGTVLLTFMVDKDGAISEIKVVNGLSPATNDKAIDLVTNGPKWTGNASGQTEQVKLHIKFPGK